MTFEHAAELVGARAASSTVLAKVREVGVSAAISAGRNVGSGKFEVGTSAGGFYNDGKKE